MAGGLSEYGVDLIAMEQERAAQSRADKQIAHTMYRQRILPSQLERARARVAQLEREAERLGMSHLLNQEQAQ